MAKLLVRVLCLAVFVVCGPVLAQAEHRLALVIGNGAYQAVPTLDNPPNDAADLAAKLRGDGFEVTSVRDGTREAMARAVGAFVGHIQTGDIALFFYAGHGLQVNGENYLIPVDARIETPSDVRFNTIDLNDILQPMTSAGSTNVIILDACRNNPFADVLAHGHRGLATRGFGRIDATGEGSLVVFSTQPNNVSLDGSGRNSPFTTALLKHIGTPGLEIRQMLSRVRGDVLAETDHKQMPWDNSSLTGDLYLDGTGASAVQAVVAPQSAPPPASAPPPSDQPKVAAVPVAPNPAERTVVPEAAQTQQAPQAQQAQGPTNDCDRLAALRIPFSSPEAVRDAPDTDWERAVTACEAMAAANPKELRFEYQLGRAYDHLKAYPKAVHAYRIAADGGFAEAWTDLATAYYFGHGVVQSYTMAFNLFSKAQADSPRALASLSSMYNDGRGVPKDNLKSLDLAEHAVDAGNPFGLYVIATHYYNGAGVAKDYKMAAQYLQQAADLGDGKSMKFLANLYESGYLGAPDPGKAQELRDRAHEVDPTAHDPEPLHLPMMRHPPPRRVGYVTRRYVVYRRVYRYGGCAYACY